MNKKEVNNGVLEKNQRELNLRKLLPIRASRLTHPGILFPVNLQQTSSEKWLQFLEIRWYVSPWYSEATLSINVLNSEGGISTWPNETEHRYIKPGQLLGSTSKTPLAGKSWAPNPYSLPWTVCNMKTFERIHTLGSQ